MIFSFAYMIEITRASACMVLFSAPVIWFKTISFINQQTNLPNKNK